MTYDQLLRQAEECLNRDDSIQAMQLYAEAAQQEPNQKEPLVRLSELFAAQGDVEGAAGFLEKAVNIEPRNAYVRLQLGLAYYELRRMSDAIRHLKASVLIIQHFVMNTRIDVMFVDDERTAEVLAEADEIEETGMQALELLRSIADEFTFDEADVRVVSERSSASSNVSQGLEQEILAKETSPTPHGAGIDGVTPNASKHIARLRLAS